MSFSTVVAGLALVPLLATAGEDPNRAPGAAPPRPELVWHAELLDGRVVASNRADVRINPASVVKVATSLWALERLGPDHRYETRFATRGTLDSETGVLEGDLVVLGGGDPDFHVENAYLVARALNELGLTRVQGRLLIDESFWIGWEGGSERRSTDPAERARLMARRLRDALDSRRWNRQTRKALADFAERRGLDARHPPRVSFAGEPALFSGPKPESVLVTHRSNPLHKTLKRFNAYSNNDIDRLGHGLGTPAELAAFLARRWNVDVDGLRLSTLSGLGVNRLTPRQVVRLLRDFGRATERQGLQVADLLPAIGCDPGTLKHFPRLGDGVRSGALVAKTGTLGSTDGGVAVIAGFAYTRQGAVVFCAAVPRAGRRLAAARAGQESWLLEMISLKGGAPVRDCGAGVVFSDDRAEVIPGEMETPQPSSASAEDRRSISFEVL